MSTAPTRKNKILVTGHPGVGKVDLIRRIVNRTSNPPPQSSTTTDQPLCLTCTLDTKYYTAEVGFWIDSAKDLTSADLEDWKQLSDSVDGFIYVFDRAKPETFQDLPKWSNFLSHTDPNISLCIANNTDTQSSPSADISTQLGEWEDWCLGNGVELIDIVQNDTEGVSGYDGVGEERVGFDRIVEALETNMWDGMRRKDGCGGKPEVQLDDDADDDHEEIGEDDDDLFGDFEDPSAVRRTHELIFGNKKDGGDDDPFERSWNTLKGLRDFGQNLPDAERRALAARVALSFGLELGDDSDEAEP
ncbi:hypothetical protein HK097_000915 [Rhizophlyctis rosea]|uniref:P-loop containing nucleoside triphosphate hydrolase protein n=1 Tax=Rhizophlyctis rosea TaxID=64517 RepID=A0AAD5S654_9FUNG|nr:hypothetical protein HK097_000915 [Rhizophlyctis rosea]